MNNGKDKELCSLLCLSGRRCAKDMECRPTHIVSKVDIEYAYRNIPVHLDDRLLLGEISYTWTQSFLLD